MILNYSFPEFEPMILDGRKKHSIRTPGRWKEGMTIHHSYGMRTPRYRCFLKNICTGVQKIEFVYPEYEITLIPCHIYIDGIERGAFTVMKLIINDGFIGFDKLQRFFNFFNKSCVKEIIHWTNLKY